MKIDWKLKGFNLLRFSCNKSTIIHPETCANMVLMNHDTGLNLTDWITGDSITTGTFEGVGKSLTDWITNELGNTINVTIPYHQNYNSGIAVGYFGSDSSIEEKRIYVPYGNNDVYGVYRTGTGLQASDGVLNLNTAGNDTLGGIKLSYQPTTASRYPLQVDENYRAYVDLADISASSSLYYWYWTGRAYSRIEYNPVRILSVYDNLLDSGHNIDLYNLQDYQNLVKGQFRTPLISKRIYPIRADINGILYTYVAWDNSIYTFSFNNNSNILTISGTNPDTITNINITPFQNVNYAGSPAVNRLTKWSNTTGTIENGPALGTATNTFLRNDGEWALPCSGDKDTVLVDNTNIISAVHQYNMVYERNAYVWSGRKASLVTMFNTFKQIEITEVGHDPESLKANIATILDAIAEIKETRAFKVVYNFEYSNNLVFVLNSTDNKEFIDRYTTSDLDFRGYGAVTINDDNSTRTSVTQIQFIFETTDPGPLTHGKLTFDVSSIDNSGLHFSIDMQTSEVVSIGHTIE